MNVKAYMCVVNSDSYSDVEVITSNNYLELIYKVIDNIMDTLGDEYPAPLRRERLCRGCADAVIGTGDKNHLVFKLWVNHSLLLGTGSRYRTSHTPPRLPDCLPSTASLFAGRATVGAWL